jgi:hypothetical protein
VDLDPLEQKTTIQIRSTLWRGDQRVAQEEYIMVSMRYFRNEVLLMLEQAGFQGAIPTPWPRRRTPSWWLSPTRVTRDPEQTWTPRFSNVGQETGLPGLWTMTRSWASKRMFVRRDACR